MEKNLHVFDIDTQPVIEDQTGTEGQPAIPSQDKPAQKDITRLIYVGPNIPGGILHKFTVFKGGKPEHINPLITKCPVLEKMFVPVKDLSKTIQAIEQKGTPENIFYRQIIEFINKGGLK